MVIPYLQLFFGFLVLIKGADFLVKGATSIARRLKISDLVIGLTVVAFGTSSPELFVNIASSIKGNTDISIGNVLGSNIANVFLILGVSSIIYPLTVTKGTIWKEIPFSLMAALIMGIMANDQIIDKVGFSILSRIDGLVLLSFFIIFMYYSFSIAKKIEGMEDHMPLVQFGLLKSFSIAILGLIGLTIGGELIVRGAVSISLQFEISQSLVGLTIVAIGTSLPELATSAVAAWKRNVEIAVGNVVGSNIFNIFFVLGMSSVIKPLPFYAKYNGDVITAIGANLILFLFMFTGEKRLLDRWEGGALIFLYGCYLWILFTKG
ncbi:MAG: calcium/sodium antiporter [Thermodesulfobacteriota bacterium]|nr:calcium/sodium antiporter [Thermodesulfobacteriota bacterium]